MELAPSHKLLTLLRVLTSAGNLLQDQLPSECDYMLRALEFFGDYFDTWTIWQSQLFKVDIYLQIQLHHQRLKTRRCPWGKAAWISWGSFCWAGSPSNGTLSLPECWWLQRRGISWPASKILDIVASLASTNTRHPSFRLELALFCICK